jgi:uroporphyrinogen-III decarboxylase
MPDIAIELPLQPWIAFQTDGLIMLSDILTPLPALRIEIDVKDECPCILSTICRLQAINNCQ